MFRIAPARLDQAIEFALRLKDLPLTPMNLFYVFAGKLELAISSTPEVDLRPACRRTRTLTESRLDAILPLRRLSGPLHSLAARRRQHS